MQVTSPSLRQQLIDAGLVRPAGERVLMRPESSGPVLGMGYWGAVVAKLRAAARVRDDDADRPMTNAGLEDWMERAWPRGPRRRR